MVLCCLIILFSIVSTFAQTNGVVVLNMPYQLQWADEVALFVDGAGHAFPYALSLAAIWGVIMALKKPPSFPGGGSE